MYFGTKPYGIEVYIENYGDGSNMLRSETFGQPRTLSPGDVLANGLEIAQNWSEEGNGRVGLHFTDGIKRIVAARIPLLLAGGTSGKSPLDLEVGDIFETGCVVLANPSQLDVRDPFYRENESEIGLTLPVGRLGRLIGVPKDLVIALSPETYPPSSETAFGAFVLRRTLSMHEGASRNLPKLGQLALDY